MTRSIWRPPDRVDRHRSPEPDLGITLVSDPDLERAAGVIVFPTPYYPDMFKRVQRSVCM